MTVWCACGRSRAADMLTRSPRPTVQRGRGLGPRLRGPRGEAAALRCPWSQRGTRQGGLYLEHAERGRRLDHSAQAWMFSTARRRRCARACRRTAVPCSSAARARSTGSMPACSNPTGRPTASLFIDGASRTAGAQGTRFPPLAPARRAARGSPTGPSRPRPGPPSRGLRELDAPLRALPRQAPPRGEMGDPRRCAPSCPTSVATARSPPRPRTRP